MVAGVGAGEAATCSARAPMPWLGVMRGSSSGNSSRTVDHHCLGTGWSVHREGSRLSAVWVGTAIVPAGPIASRSASTTVTAPPHTQPSRRIEECTRTTLPGEPETGQVVGQ